MVSSLHIIPELVFSLRLTNDIDDEGRVAAGIGLSAGRATAPQHPRSCAARGIGRPFAATGVYRPARLGYRKLRRATH